MVDGEGTICNGGTPLVGALIFGAEPSGGGLLLPIGGNFERAWGTEFQTILYFLGLFYMFIGVMLIADVFMSAIEKITSKKVRKVNARTGKLMTVDLWNPTVANLTLMALGSSAPEILLSVIELLSNSMHSGDLGPSTIVGSAAFNLLCIIAVCVVCIPDGESRKIKELHVFVVTAIFSVFAYVWLLIILLLISPHVIEWWEGMLTFGFFPILCVVAYLVDIGWLHKTFGLEHHGSRKLMLTADSTPEEIDRMILEVQKKYGDMSAGIEQELLHWEFDPPTSRAARRMSTSKQMTGGKDKEDEAKFTMRQQRKAKATDIMERSSAENGSQAKTVIQFEHQHYHCHESESMVHIVMQRTGDCDCTTNVRVRTEDGGATSGSDYIALNEIYTFEPGETQKMVSVRIVDDDEEEDIEEFFVKLELPESEQETTKLGPANRACVLIIDDDNPGVIRFDRETVTVQESPDVMELRVTVLRNKGTRGEVSCTYYTEDDTAFAGADFEEAKGILKFGHGVASATIGLQIQPKGRHEQTEQFRLVLESATNGAIFDETTDGMAEKCICTIFIVGNEANRSVVRSVLSKMAVNQDQMDIGKTTWRANFVDAVYVGGSFDAQEDADVVAWIFHILIFPWKMLCACVPPPSFCGGWLCFVSALLVIGIQTAVIGDLANMLGCALDMSASITAITIVAIGTSLPDLFASRTAAVQDETADASIVNVTGSNSVNVFLGLGLPWMIASIYWLAKGVDLNDPSDPWVKRGMDAGWLDKNSHLYVSGVEVDYLATFVVPAGSLGASVSVFSCCAFTAICIILLRRRFLGAELGGPKTVKYLTGVIFVMLWLVYIILSILAA